MHYIKITELYKAKMGACSRILCTYLRLVIILSLHTVFIITVISRVIGSSTWSWPAIFTPLFLFDVICVIYIVVYMVVLIRKKLEDDPSYHNTMIFPHQRVSPLPPVFYCIGVLTKVIAEILLVVHLDNGGVPFYAVGIFLALLFAAVAVAMMFYSLKPTLKIMITRQ